MGGLKRHVSAKHPSTETDITTAVDVKLTTLRCLINVSPVSNSFFFFQPSDFIRTPLFVNFEINEFISGLLCYFLSLLELFTPNFQAN